MKSRRFASVSAMACLAAVFAALAGCAGVRSPASPLSMPVHTVGYPQTDKLPLRIALEVPEKLRSATWNVEHLGTVRAIPLGIQLAHNAEVLAHRLFTDIVAADAPGESVDAVLLLRLAYAQQRPQSLPLISTTGGVSPVLAIGLEWTLKSASGATIWAQTVAAEFNEQPRSFRDTWGKSMDTLFAEWTRKTLDKAFQESLRSLSSAQAISSWRPAKDRR